MSDHFLCHCGRKARSLSIGICYLKNGGRRTVRIKKITEIPPVESRCISVKTPEKLFMVGGENGASVVTHNSVIQRCFIFGCIMRPEEWLFLGIDLKIVELAEYRKYAPSVLGVATTLEDALTVLRFAHQVMLDRYSRMGLNYMRKLSELRADTGQQICRIMVMIDELAQLMIPKKGNADRTKLDNEMIDECNIIIGDIARLGRAAGVHLVAAIQRPDASIVGGEIRANFDHRIVAGNVNSTASTMVLDNNQGTKVPTIPKGRVFIQTGDVGRHAQGIFTADADAIAQWWKKQQKSSYSSASGGGDSMMASIKKEAAEKNNTSDDPGGSIQNTNNNSGGIGTTSAAVEGSVLELNNQQHSSRRAEDDWDDTMQEIYDVQS